MKIKNVLRVILVLTLTAILVMIFIMWFKGYQGSGEGAISNLSSDNLSPDNLSPDFIEFEVPEIDPPGPIEQLFYQLGVGTSPNDVGLGGLEDHDYSSNDFLNVLEEALIELVEDGVPEEVIDELENSLIEWYSNDTDNEEYLPTNASGFIVDFPKLPQEPVNCYYYYHDAVIDRLNIKFFDSIITDAYLEECFYEGGDKSMLYSLTAPEVDDLVIVNWLYILNSSPDDIRVFDEKLLTYYDHVISRCSAITNDRLIRLEYNTYTNLTLDLMIDFLGFD